MTELLIREMVWLPPVPVKVLSGEFYLRSGVLGFNFCVADCFSLFSCVADADIALYKDLWRACAGPLVTVPRENELVFYFPQGHIEQV